MKLKDLLIDMEKVRTKIDVAPAYFTGGVVRDRIMNKIENVSDLDFCNGEQSIGYLSEEFYNFLSKNYNVTRKIMNDGHSTIYIGSLKLDFSSNFVVDGIDEIMRKKGYSSLTPLQKEVFSRDFTCNSLLTSLDLKNTFDLTEKGLQDIKNKKIRTCLDPKITLTTNKNRVARSIYLACKLDFDLDQSIIDFVKKYPQSIKISTEKSLKEKLNEAFTRDGDKASYLLSSMNLWNFVPISEIMYPYYKKVGTK